MDVEIHARVGHVRMVVDSLCPEPPVPVEEGE